MRNIITEAKALSDLEKTESAISTSPTSQMGRRSAYEKLMEQQRSISHGECNVTLFSVFTSYSIQKKTPKNVKELNSPPLLTIDDIGIIHLNEKTKKIKLMI